MSFSDIMALFSLALGIALIIWCLVKPVKLLEGESVDDYKKFSLYFKLTNVFYGLLLIFAGSFIFQKVVPPLGAIFLFLIIEVLQRQFYKYFIRESEEKTVEETDHIGIDDILSEDFFKNKEEEENKLDKENEEKENFDLEAYDKKCEIENKEILENLIKKGKDLGIIDKDYK